MSVAAADQLREHLISREMVRMGRALDVTRQDTIAAESRRTGDMAAATMVDPVEYDEPRLRSRIHIDVDYAGFQDVGTGIYGPSGMRIFPKTAKALRFDWPAAGGVVFARSIAGAPGRHFFHEPMPERWHAALLESAPEALF